MQPAMTCAVHILAYTISNFVVLSLMIRKAKYIRIFVLMYTNLLFCFQIRLLCYRFGCPATDLAAVPQIWPTWLKFTYYATDLATVPHNWPPCHIWPPCHRYACCVTDLAVVVLDQNKYIDIYEPRSLLHTS